MARIPKSMIKRKFELWCKDVGLEPTTWRRVEATATCHGNKCTVGTVGLDYYMGWHVEMTTNDRGGVTILNRSRMTPGELLAWFEGSAFVLELQRETAAAILKRDR